MIGLERKKRILGAWCWVWCAVFLLACLRTGAVMFHHVGLDYNEGWNAQLASWQAGQGDHRLYSSENGFVFNNYPPLSFIIFGWVVKQGGDAIVVGRIVSCLSVILSSCLIARFVKIVTRSGLSAWMSASVFLMTVNTAFYSYFGMNDPQWLAHLLMLSGLSILFSSQGVSFACWRLALSALLIVLAGFVKHNLVALPLALCVWIFLCDKKKALLWAGIVLVLVGGGFDLCYNLYGMGFFYDVFLHKRTVWLGRIVHGLGAVLLMGGILSVGIGLSYYYRREVKRKDSIVLIVIYLFASLLFGLLGAMGAGVDYNIMFDVLISGSILCGVCFSKLLEDSWHENTVFVMCCIVSLPLLFLLPARGVSFYRDIKNIQSNAQIWAKNIDTLKTYKNDTLCTDMTLCYWAHAPYSVDMFNLAQALKIGGQKFLIQEAVMMHKFAFVQVYGAPKFYRGRSDIFNNWLKKAGYHPVFTGQGDMILLGYGPQGR